MSPIQPLTTLLRRLWGHISPRRQWQFAILLILMIVASFAEIVSIGAVLPFLTALTAPDYLFQHPAAQPLIRALGLAGPQDLLLPITLLFISASLLAGAVRIVMLWANTRFSFATGADLSINAYRRTLYQPYAVHVARNSSDVINGITGKINVLIYSVIQPVMSTLTSVVMLLVILVAMLSIEPLIVITAFGGFSLIYALVIGVTKKRLQANSQRIAAESTQVIKALQEGLGGIRDVLLDGTQPTYCTIYRNSDLPLRRAQGNSGFLALSPRFAVEALGMVLIATLAYGLSGQPGGTAEAIPILGALALGAQRLLPVLQQAYASWASIQGAGQSFRDALDFLDQPLPAHAGQPAQAPMPFERDITLKKLSFRYGEKTPLVLNDINLTIKKGSRIGLIGCTGSGKSTLLDIVMGLLVPTQGSLEIDGLSVTPANHRGWQAHIAHVPQAIYLADCSIAENIAFGVPKDQIDFVRVRLAARQAQIADVIESWVDGYLTPVGERGIRLSGGQRQRIGIARALYKNADVIIFDEATSALDNATEHAVMQTIENLNMDLTVLIIAHRITTLKNCSQIVELGGGRIKQICSYQDIAP